MSGSSRTWLGSACLLAMLLARPAAAQDQSDAVLVKVGEKEDAFALSGDSGFKGQGAAHFCRIPARILDSKCVGNKLYLQVDHNLPPEPTGDVPGGAFDVVLDWQRAPSVEQGRKVEAQLTAVLADFPALHARVWNRTGTCLWLAGNDEKAIMFRPRIPAVDLCQASVAPERGVFVLNPHAGHSSLEHCASAHFDETLLPESEAAFDKPEAAIREQAATITQAYASGAAGPVTQQSTVQGKVWIQPDAASLKLFTPSEDRPTPVTGELAQRLEDYRSEPATCDVLLKSLPSATPAADGLTPPEVSTPPVMVIPMEHPAAPVVEDAPEPERTAPTPVEAKPDEVETPPPPRMGSIDMPPEEPPAPTLDELTPYRSSRDLQWKTGIGLVAVGGALAVTATALAIASSQEAGSFGPQGVNSPGISQAQRGQLTGTAWGCYGSILGALALGIPGTLLMVQNVPKSAPTVGVAPMGENGVGVTVAGAIP